MSLIKVQATVTGELFHVDVFLLGNLISLNNNGKTVWRSTNVVEVFDGILDVLVRARGVPTTKWTLEIKQLEPTSRDLFKDEFAIKPNGISEVPVAVNVK